jgi:phosphatidylserine/phosphatidylglycerophosphate/cardiolipin synthase-like enzyme
MLADIVPLPCGLFYDELIACIDASRIKILTCQYQWKWNIHQRHSHVQRLGAAIERARARNVKVRVVLHQEAPGRHLTTINRVSGDQLARMGCLVNHFSTSTLLHAKLWSIDGRLSFVGSHNISTRSLTQNEEFSVKIVSVDFAREIEKYIDLLWR